MMKVVTIISGGLDSVGYSIKWDGPSVKLYPLVFDYGQKGRKEIEAAVELSKKLGFEKPKVLDISFMTELWGGTQLTDNEVTVEEVYTPSVVVPIRNAIFLTIGTAYAYTIGANKVIYGSHLGDCKPSEDSENLWFAQYPDCSPEFVLALEAALRVGHFRQNRDLEIWSPAREGMTKVDILLTAYHLLGKDKDLIFSTWSCYKLGETHCGVCESCRNRKVTFEEAGIKDLTKYAN